MSDRREAVARAIYEFDEGSISDNVLPWDLFCERWEGSADRYRRMADAAIAAYEAHQPEPTCPECGGAGDSCGFCGGTGMWPRTEPTDAEIEAASQAYWDYLAAGPLDKLEAMRDALTAFLAARKARQ